jgi:folate-binding protein YgfZ
MKATFLDDRGVVQVSGDDARKFLNGLFTTDVTKLTPGDARFGALLTPQGKIIVDFLVAQMPSSEAGERFVLDCPRALAQALTDKLNVYKLRAKVAVTNVSDQLGVIALWDGAAGATLEGSFTDPRHAGLGTRVIAPQAELAGIAARLGADIVGSDAYGAHRIDCSVPRGGLDFMYGDAFPHETNMDRLHGVDIGKGCYVGQEVVSRMHHRGTARTRAVQVLLDGPSPEPGTPITAGDKSVGTMGSASQQKGIALLRIDRTMEAIEAGTPLTSGGLTLRVADLDALQGPPKQTVA